MKDHYIRINIKGMSPREYKNGGEYLHINYSYLESPFGKIIIASTTKGICYMAFINNEVAAFEDLSSHFPQVKFKKKRDSVQLSALSIFTHDLSKLDQIKLHLKGTDFQLKVWKALLKIPFGKLTTYGNIAQRINLPRATRAVGTAISSNPVAFLIPCHRVIQSTGAFGNYRWGRDRKTAMIGWEAAKVENI